MVASILSSYGGYGGAELRRNLLDKADANGDAAVSKTELFSLLSGKKTEDKDEEDVAELARKLFSQLDKDGDGQLSQAEMQAAQPPRFDVGTGQALLAQQEAGKQPPADDDQLFADADTDGDGILTADELRTALKNAVTADVDSLLSALDAAKPHGPPPPPPPAGQAEQAESLFSSLDTDGDGQVSADEWAKATQGLASANTTSTDLSAGKLDSRMLAFLLGTQAAA
jgi:hypothetical protein